MKIKIIKIKENQRKNEVLKKDETNKTNACSYKKAKATSNKTEWFFFKLFLFKMKRIEVKRKLYEK